MAYYGNFKGGVMRFLEMPEWLIFALLYVVCIAVLPFGRWIFEGKAYNVSFTSQYGDVAIFLSLLISVEILKQLPAAMPSTSSLTSFLIISVLGGIFMTAMEWSKPKIEVMDFYHAVVIVPLLLFASLMAV